MEILIRWAIVSHTIKGDNAEMNFQDFKTSLQNDTPPQNISSALEALWHQAKGDWDTAHTIAQSQKNPMGNWIHAYLHRVEGDDVNAAYWYHRASKPICTSRMAVEWDEIVMALINANQGKPG